MGKSVLWLASLLLLVVAASGVEEQLSEPGGLKPVDISDPKYQSLAKITVEIHNWQVGSNLQFLELVCGWSRIVRGINYQFCLRLIDKDNNNAVFHYKIDVTLDPSANIFINDFHLVPIDLECCFARANGKAKAKA
ncbi:cystatin-1-like [Momordica charantia]|uniref:Cystatin-1-like n=1 Tax=Momordica charantia TaxID=3673 RepID=A0A6J1CNV2_MOMCH|nr:cystatin-1-like [Momordica charantia]